MCKLIYKNYLSSGKCKSIITVDEALANSCDCNWKISIYYQKRREKDLTCCSCENEESVTKCFMIITGFSCNGKLKIRTEQKYIN